MELSTPTRDATIRLDDLRALAALGLLRLPAGEAEARRAARMRTMVDAASQLTRAVAAHTHCLLVNCQGSHGTGNLADETERLHAALAEYGELVRELGREGRHLLGSPVATDAVTEVRHRQPSPVAAVQTLRRAG